MKDKTKVNFNIDKTLWKNFRKISLDLEKNATEIMVELIANFVKENKGK